MIQVVVVFALLLLFDGASIEVLWVIMEVGLCLVRGCEVSEEPVVWVCSEVSMQYGVGWVVLQEVGLE